MELKNSISDFISNVDIKEFIWLYYTQQFMAGFNMPVPHRHKGYEIILAIDGTGNIICGSSLVTLQKNDFLILESKISHRFYVEENHKCTLMNIHLDFDACNILSVEKLSAVIKNRVGSKGFYKIANNHEIKGLMSSIISKLSDSSDNSLLSAGLQFCELLLAIEKISPANSVNLPSVQMKYVNNAVKFIENNFHQQINPETIANFVHVSPDYLLHLFKKHTGNSIMDFVLNIRIEHGKNLLQNTDLSITNIAFSSGILNSQYFSTCFRKSTGLSPSKYRKLIRLVNNSN